MDAGSLDPIKLYEYQAVGRPIVSTPVAGFRDAEGVTVAEGAAFADAVVAAVTAPRTAPVAAQGASARAADWRQRVAEFRRAAEL